MRGSIVKRGTKRFALVLELGYVTDPTTGTRRRKQKWIAFRGTATQAEKKLTELVGSVDTHTFVEPSQLTLAAWLKTWLDKAAKPPLRRPATCRVYKSIVENHLTTSPLALMPIQRVRATDIKKSRQRTPGRTGNRQRPSRHLASGAADRHQGPTDPREPSDRRRRAAES